VDCFCSKKAPQSYNTFLEENDFNIDNSMLCFYYLKLTSPIKNVTEIVTNF